MAYGPCPSNLLRPSDPGTKVLDQENRDRVAGKEGGVMDTVENRWILSNRKDDGSVEVKSDPPIVWRDKSAKEVHSSEYPHLQLKPGSTPPRSTRSGVDYCRSFSVGQFSGKLIARDGDVVQSTLTEID